MTSNCTLKEFILLTNDEYLFLKNQTQKQSRRLNYCQKKKQQFPAQVVASTSSNNESEEITNPPIDKEQSLIAQVNLNSRFQAQKKPSTKTSTSQVNADYWQSSTPDNVKASLM